MACPTKLGLSVIHEHDGKVNWKQLSNARKKLSVGKDTHRDGPAPKKGKIAGLRCSIGALDSDFEGDDEDTKDNTLSRSQKSKGSFASNQALIVYFAKLARAPDSELVDFRFIESIFHGGADVNATDKHGQTILHEVARNWNIDVAYYIIRNGANVNKGDKWGRTPLHLAAAVDHGAMVHFLIQNGANIHEKTLGEAQTPIHYAAKYNASKSLKVLMECSADVNARDFKGRTPLFVAAEAAREDAARFLVEKGVPAGVFNESGVSALALMIEKMPGIASEALQQFITIDHAFRKEYYYLSYLEADPKAWTQSYDEHVREKCDLQLHNVKKNKKKKKRKMLLPFTPLKMAVECQELDILMHPVMQRLINVKWNLFGKWAAIFGAGFHFLYIMIWTWLAIFLPRDGVYYSPASKHWWRILLEFLGCVMTLYFIMKQIWEIKTTRTDRKQQRSWKIQDIYRDIDYCHPRWPDEKTFLESELREIQRSRYNYFDDPWNIMDCLTYVAVLTVIITRFLAVFLSNKTAVVVHPRAYSVALILLWVHFMKSCRAFTSLGPFIVMLGYVMKDTLRFAFLFFEFFIPYVCAFWILFGGPKNAAVMEKEGANSVDWAKFGDLTFSVWQVTLIADFNMDGLFAVDRLMGQILVGTYFAIASTVCINLFIALLSETFSRVYQNAKANAALLQATTILQIEKALTKQRRSKVQKYIHLECSPLEVYQSGGGDSGSGNSAFMKLSRQIEVRLDEFEEFCGEAFSHIDGKIDTIEGGGTKKVSSASNHRPSMVIRKLKQQEKELAKMRDEIYEMKCFALRQLGEVAPTRPLLAEGYASDTESVTGSNFAFSNPDSVPRGSDLEGQDVIRHLLDRKLQEMDISAREQGKKRRKRRKKKSYATDLSDSWETIPGIDDDF